MGIANRLPADQAVAERRFSRPDHGGQSLATSVMDLVTETINQGAIYKLRTKPFANTQLREVIAKAFGLYESTARKRYA